MEKVEIRTHPTRLKPLVVGEKVYRSSFDYELSPDDVLTARMELNETEEVRTRSLGNLKEMLSGDGIIYPEDDAYLLRFLRCRKFKCKEAYKMMRYFYSVRKELPEVYNTLPSDLETSLNSNPFTCLPHRDEDGSIIFVNRYGRWNPKKTSVNDLFQFFQPICDVVTMNPSCQIKKVVFIFDLGGTNVSHFSACLYPSTLIYWTRTCQNLYPWRIKRVFVVNCPRIGLAFLSAIRYLLKKKISERIVVTGSDFKELHEYINPAILPKEYGGSLEQSEYSATQHVMDNLPYLEHEYAFCNKQKL